ncbi:MULTISPECIES: hypothetical protein [Pseudomonas]|uniref:Secreted protein n=2 Tax=Pseudomonas TaxID=286 RepID=A0A9Q6IEM4_9PSED|nr:MULTISPECIES: hypothetical protein [Pseudomonas]MBS7558953.1 hypothetical protein [Pseudomonas sp. RC4D1]MCO7576360.1 hypothetical protein [Pseudomonas protegens]MCO7583146.1 hypothetical protein [Pseudomonas chlororaphis]MCO7599739.1 hypothetical protein [Pseudomonas chlororaphis]MCY7264031.1 hypothetical protein [Pseudomonas protegens]
MRLTQLLTLAAPLALLLPLSAQAAWPAGARADYMKDCTAAASQSIDAKSAEKHCACGAEKLNEKFTTDEIKELMSKSKQPSAELRTRALDAIAACRVVK